MLISTTQYNTNRSIWCLAGTRANEKGGNSIKSLLEDCTGVNGAFKSILEQVEKTQAENKPKQKPDCPKCNDDYFYNDGDRYKSCPCRLKKDSLQAFDNSPLGAMKEKYTFENFKQEQDFQKKMYERAKNYVIAEFKQGKWLYIGGQVGTGKTHLCTAVLQKLITKHNVISKYHVTGHILGQLKQLEYDSKEEFTRLINGLVNVQILFLDDFVRNELTNADKRLLFDIINDRYLLNKTCIISSENTMQELLAIDQAIASRIFEKSTVIDLKKDSKRNYRLNV